MMNNSPTLKFAFPLFLCLCFAFLSTQSLQAQCDNVPETGVHIVKQNENLFRIAQQYNISVDDICLWNSIQPTDKVYQCQSLVVSAALVNPLPSNFSIVNAGREGVEVKKQQGKWHTVRPGESIANIAYAYGYTENRFREFNHIKFKKSLKPGALVRTTDCVCESAVVTPTKVDTEGPGATGTGTTKINDSRDYMTVAESSMIDEINLMRSNPSAYVKHVRAFVKEYEEVWGSRISPSAVNSLIRDLEKSPPLSVLRPHKCLYQLAKTHGDYLKRTGRFQHTDANGVGPWSRSMKACPQVKMSTSKGRSGMLIGNENLVAGHDNVRQSVIELLIDEGINPPGHREALLGPEWRYVACYNFGTVNGMPNHWVQNFGR